MKKRSQKRRRAIAKPRRANPPKLFVEVPSKSLYGGPQHARAHLRNKRGYVYLCWREGLWVKNFYLGKAPRSSPTKVPSSSAIAPAPGRGRRRVDELQA